MIPFLLGHPHCDPLEDEQPVTITIRAAISSNDILETICINSIGNLIYFHQRKAQTLELHSHSVKNPPPRRVLVAPLDWGLGHATRCVPIIKLLQNKGFEVIIGAEGKIASLLGTEFPGIKILPLPGYRISYAKRPSRLLLKLFASLPSALRTYFKSSRIVKKWVREYGISAVISDNRPELKHCGTHSIYITHQLAVKTGSGLLDKIASKIHRHFINCFDQCWVPDQQEKNNLAGELSHPATMPRIPVSYIGCLSRFSKQISTNAEHYDFLVLLSGPEPQRSILENKILDQLKNINGRIALVRGLPGNKDNHADKQHLKIFEHLPSEELNRMVLSSAIIIARCGYSTVMDLALTGRKAILIPTPGQGEQEYLAGYLKQNNFFYTVKQADLKLESDLKSAGQTIQQIPEIKGMNEEEIIKSLNRFGINPQ